MLISTETGAAQMVSDGAEPRFYDDVGCLTADWPLHAGEAIPFVRAGSGWIDARTAFFARSSAARTAMDSGLVAYANAVDANASDRNGRALTWDEALALAGDTP